MKWLNCWLDPTGKWKRSDGSKWDWRDEILKGIELFSVKIRQIIELDLMLFNNFFGTEVNLHKTGHITVEDEFQSIEAGGIATPGTSNPMSAVSKMNLPNYDFR